MQWPIRPTCHDDRMSAIGASLDARPTWHAPSNAEDYSNGEYDHTQGVFRTCSYCGSICPEDFAKWCQVEGIQITLSMSDWKYGWPHKFYVNGIPNPRAGEQRKVGSLSGQREDGTLYTAPRIGRAPDTLFCKLYTVHLEDRGYDDEAQELLLRLVNERADMVFERELQLDGAYRVKYSARYLGYRPT